MFGEMFALMLGKFGGMFVLLSFCSRVGCSRVGSSGETVARGGLGVHGA